MSRLLRDAGLEIVGPEVGELVTSLDMAGCSLTLMWLDDELERFWRAGPCLLVCDAEVTPLRPAILYGIDMRATREIDELSARFGESRIVERCGSALSTQAVGPKMMWIQRYSSPS